VISGRCLSPVRRPESATRSRNGSTPAAGVCFPPFGPTRGRTRTRRGLTAKAPHARDSVGNDIVRQLVFSMLPAREKDPLIAALINFR
jgi:hypothetical protein